MTTFSLPATKYRIESIDILRGLIMLIMAIDHTRDFFHQYAPNPTDLETTTPILFFTRWITHFCAAIFVFLSGVSVNLAGTRRSKKQLSLFLVKRGLWLIIVEFLLISFAITLDPLYHLLIFQVIWVIGVSMIILGFMIWLPMPVIAAIGILLFFGHDLLTTMNLPSEGTAGFLNKLFLTAFAYFYPITETHSLLILYAILPWTGVMLLGYVLGTVYKANIDPIRRRKVLLQCGLGLIVTFIIFRYLNIYGDPSPWRVQKSLELSIISFFNVSKYPPSLMYCCMTIGPGLLLLLAFERLNNRFTKLLVVFGSVPFFYYVLHFYLLRLLNILLFYWQGYSAKDLTDPKSIMLFHPENFGLNLFGVYLVWGLVIFILYFPSKWFSKYRKEHTQLWLSYL